MIPFGRKVLGNTRFVDIKLINIHINTQINK